MNGDIAAYYRDRAREYDKVYLNPAEQGDLLKATNIFQGLFAQKTVLEIACGTGYWTERISQTATSVHATDINEELIDIAKGKTGNNNVTFSIADMYNMAPGKKYSGLFGGFIWSHILLQDLDDFLKNLNAVLVPGSVLAFIDSKQVNNSPHDAKRITHTDEQGNTYQTRSLENGSKHQVLKNYPSREFIVGKLSGISDNIEYLDLEYYWIVTSRIHLSPVL